MIGPILLALSWLLLRLEGRGLAAIGVDQPRRRLAEFAAGFAFMGLIAAVQQLGKSLAAGDPFVPNPSASAGALAGGLRFVINSVLFEEFLFRGYLLYQAVRILGRTRAVVLAAAAFGIYHWFSYGIIGNPVAMVYVFVLTGAFGYMWARAFTSTGSIAAPIGLHLGWNAISYLVFSAGPAGPGLLAPASGARILVVGGWPALMLNVVLPLAAVVAGVLYDRLRQR